jgi:ABC-type nitrate/sulfonate/bicarbonate transport system ATPase subunit
MIDKREIKGYRELLDVMTGKKQVEECKVLGKKSQKKVQYEAKEQEALFQWAKLQENVYPGLKLLHAIPNGGSRHKLEAYGLKRQGVCSLCVLWI